MKKHISTISNNLEWFFLIVSIWIVSAYYIDTIKISTSLNEKTVSSINDILLALALAYIAGMFVYILTVYIPVKRKRKVILYFVSEDLRYLKDEMYDFSITICDGNWLERDKVRFQDIMNGMAELGDDDLYSISQNNVKFMKERMSRFDSYLRVIISFHNYLLSDELRDLQEIRNSHSFDQLRHDFEFHKEKNYDKDALSKLVDDLVTTNQKIVDLYGKINKRLNEEQRNRKNKNNN